LVLGKARSLNRSSAGPKDVARVQVPRVEDSASRVQNRLRRRLVIRFSVVPSISKPVGFPAHLVRVRGGRGFCQREGCGDFASSERPGARGLQREKKPKAFGSMGPRSWPWVGGAGQVPGGILSPRGGPRREVGSLGSSDSLVRRLACQRVEGGSRPPRRRRSRKG
jgi:hypothetical protein